MNETNDYEYDVDQCSVCNKVLLRKFREKRSEWIGWLELDEHHNIWAQLHSLMWNDAIYRSLNEAKRFSSEDNRTAAINGSLCDFVDIGYVSTQILAVCKVTDKENNVISLRRLFKDIRKSRSLFTRENFVSYDGLPYGFETAKQADIWDPTVGPDAWGMSQTMHIAFDKLSGIAPDQRTRTDLIHEEVFDTIEAWLDEPILEKLRTLRNKFVAHAADAPSRQARPLERLGLSLDEIEEAQRTVIKIATAIESQLLYHRARGGVVPTPQFDVFENFEMPLIPAINMTDIGQWWHRHLRERESWLRERPALITE